jgi:alpha-amylase/alpha-mannosidase (GH57 family)
VFQNSTSNGIVVDGSDLANQTDLTAGDFFKVEDNYLTTIFNCFREWNLSYSAIKSKIESIELGYNGDSNRLLVNMRSGVQIIVRNAKQGLSDKLNLAFSIYDTDTDTQTGEPVDYTKSGIIEVFENETKIYASYRQV